MRARGACKRLQCSSVLGRMVQNASAGVGGGCAVLRMCPRWRQSVQYRSYAAAALFFAACLAC